MRKFSPGRQMNMKEQDNEDVISMGTFEGIKIFFEILKK